MALDSERIQTIVTLLGMATSSGSNQSQVLTHLEKCSTSPDFNTNLAYIFASGDQLPVEVRQGAGLLLKNILTKNGAWNSLSEESRGFVKSSLLMVLPHSLVPLRQTAGTIASTVYGAGGSENWPQLISSTSSFLQSTEEAACDGGLDLVYKLIEDHMRLFDFRGHAGGPSACDQLMVPLLHLMQSHYAPVRGKSISCLNLLLREMPSALFDQLDVYLQGLLSLAHDTSSLVRREVCIGLVQLLSIQPHRLQPYLYQLVEYMLVSNEHADDQVALESCEFWMGYCDAELDPELLQPFLPRLIPLLMKNMVFDEYDDEVQEAEEAEKPLSNSRQDRDSEIKPFIASDRAGAPPTSDEGGEDEEEEDGEGLSKWNLRRCSAAGLDRLSLVYGDELLPILLPIVEQRLKESDWRARESSILALGAVAEGCHNGLLPFLGGIVSMVQPMLRDPRPMVRVISCWTLTRYSRWLVLASEQQQVRGGWGPESSLSPSALSGVVQGVLERVLDHNKFVQEAACSSLANLLEQAGTDAKVPILGSYLVPIVETLAVAIQRFTRRNMRLLYDVLGTLSETFASPEEDGSLGLHTPTMSTPDVCRIYLPPLLQRLVGMNVSTDKQDLLPLMDSMVALLPNASRELALPYARSVHDKCLHLASVQFEIRHRAPLAPESGASSIQSLFVGGQGGNCTGKEGTEFDKDAIVCSLDLLSSLAVCLGEGPQGIEGVSMDPGGALPPLILLMLQCCKDQVPEIRQSAFALAGDLSKSSPALMMPVVPDFLNLSLAVLDPQLITRETLKSCNNACWAVGELVVRLPAGSLAQSGMAEKIAERTAGILLYPGRLTKSIMENSAITLGRVAYVSPERVAPHLSHFFSPWCNTLRGIRDDLEKEHAFLGLFSLIPLNPEPALTGFVPLAGAVVSWRKIKNEALAATMKSVIQTLQQQLASNGKWQQTATGLDMAVSQKLSTMTQ